jgi:hypothetical protein
MEVGNDNMVEPVRNDANIQQALYDAMPAVKKNGRAIQLQEHAGGPPRVFDLARSSAKQGKLIHLRVAIVK